MVKPACHIRILWRVRERFGKPTAVYHVSGNMRWSKAPPKRALTNVLHF